MTNTANPPVDLNKLLTYLLQIKTFFCLLKIIFQNSQNLLRRNASEIKIFLQLVEMEKLKLSLLKQHNKILKIKSEMLEIRKNVKIIKLEKFPANFFGNFPNPGNPEDFRGFRKLSGSPEKFFENFPFPG